MYIYIYTYTFIYIYFTHTHIYIYYTYIYALYIYIYTYIYYTFICRIYIYVCVFKIQMSIAIVKFPVFLRTALDTKHLFFMGKKGKRFEAKRKAFWELWLRFPWAWPLPLGYLLIRNLTTTVLDQFTGFLGKACLATFWQLSHPLTDPSLESSVFQWCVVHPEAPAFAAAGATLASKLEVDLMDCPLTFDGV